MNHQTLWGLTLLWLLTAPLAAGCASPWEKHYEPNPDLGGAKFARVSSVQVRTIPFERYQQYVDAERKRRIESSTAPQDLDREQQLAAKNRLLETLQVSERSDAVQVLGWSEFTDEEQLSPHDPRLRSFAQKIGADLVVVASTYAGQVTRIEDRPVTTYSHGFTTFTRPRGRRGTFGTSYSDQSTTWVPMQVTEAHYFYEAIFLRRQS